VTKFDAKADALYQAGWLTKADWQSIKEKAAESVIP